MSAATDVGKFQTLSTELERGVLTVTLDRPDRMNAFTVDMANELVLLFTEVNVRDEVRAVVVTGAGRAFCAGMELASEGNVFGLDESQRPMLSDMGDLDDPQILRGVRDTGGRVTLAIFECRKPVIAAINGPAVGIGATMTLAMDIRLASEEARIGFVFGKLGIVPEAASTWFLPRIVGMARALEWVYSAEILSAEEARDGGLVSRVVAATSLLEEAQDLARRISQNRSPVAVALTRQMMYRNSALPHPREAHRIDSLAMFYTSAGDGKDGVRAFLEKREPRFSSSAHTGMPPFYPWWDDE
ncbi:crotonase/enoyl-CoA hydratase family protein [Streptomyces brasiliensis]|uniref:Enoyl-CoA hydratase n=1 Tax=Streptomyces brasiliensis TaxID=1954 RepID=A0A917L504_9ACTN|nr:crotonase/enoyl-CoA hydratase family protein [Streptomyces brasiliensis]GGJ40798.1 enoyl-CoA hydratase [Streptomyces brasiliensis]